MSRRGGGKPAGIQLFPFLAVLICTMGALVVLLHAFARHGQEQAMKIARAKAKAESKQEKMDVEDVQWRISHLRDARAKTAAQLANERLKLSHVEDHQRRLGEKLEQLKIAAAELERAAEQKSSGETAAAAELAAVQAKLNEAKRALDAARADGTRKSVSYAVIPYEGRNSTRRRPIYIECRESLIVLQPEGVELSPRDFAGVFGPGNPLASAVRAKSEYLARQAPPGSAPEEPYPLLLVRPEGVAAYYAARAALDSWGSEFGYELVGSDWPLKFPPPDPQLVLLTRKVVAEARLRYREYTLSSPQVAKTRSRPVYRARAHGGFAPVGGSGAFGTGGRGAGWDEFAGAWARGGDAISEGDPYGEPNSSEDRAGSGAFPSRGGADFQDPYSDSPDGVAGNGAAKTHPGGPQTHHPGEPPYTGGNGNDARQSGTPQGEAGGDPETHDSAGQPTGTTARQSFPSGAAGGSHGQSAESLVDLPQPGGGGNGPPSHAASPPAPHATLGHHKTSMASTRGSDWGLPESSAGAVAATRPILVECYPDRLILQSETRGVPAREIHLAERTEDSIDELVSAVWDHMKGWGKAGKGLYWRPTLSINVQPGAAARFDEIQALLADSGLDVHRRGSRAAGAPAGNNRR
jgi:hypothetical protein